MGPALNRHRQARERFTEEIDVVGAHRRNLVLVGECKWTADPMSKRVLDDLREYKLPALEQERRLKVPKQGPQTLLFSRTGFSDELITTASSDDTVSLVTLDELVSELDREVTQPTAWFRPAEATTRAR